MKKHVFTAIGLLVLIFALNACGQGDSTAERQTKSLSAVGADRVGYEMKHFQRQEGNCEQPDSNCALIELSYPHFSNNAPATARSAINAYIERWLFQPVFNDMPLHSFNELVQHLFSEYRSMRRDMPDYTFGWAVQRTVTVLYNVPPLLSLSYEEFVNTGGAHPNESRHFANFDVTTGRRLALADLLTAGFESQLQQIAERHFREGRNIPYNASLNAEGFNFPNNRFQLTDNFAVTASGLKFYFNPYEIAPYAMGPTEVLVPYADLQDLLKADGPLAVLIFKKTG